MKNIFIILIAIALFSSCKESEIANWDSSTKVYFNHQVGGSSVDSIGFYFIDENVKEALVPVHIQIAGNIATEDKKVRIFADTEQSDVEEDVHFALEDYYIFKAGQERDTIYIKLINEDPDLATDIFGLVLKLEATEDLELGIEDKLQFKINFSGDVIQPASWKYIQGSFGYVYSKVKHKTCIEIMGRDFPSIDEYFENSNYWNFEGYKCGQYFKENTVYDENGLLIMGW
ncbi:MAG: DUF4843 domain-containing protein [Carboxylicivirga sp.]|jgi:hypothetical protein|nr:DUF4843 domain-containing protein [Carboxylicivirga sp.]